MGHRRSFFPSQASEMNYGDMWRSPLPDPQLHMDNTAMRRANQAPYFDQTLRMDSRPPPNFGMQISVRGGANRGTLHDSFMHPSSASSSDFVPPNYIQEGPSCFNQFAGTDAEIALNSEMNYGRTQFKRKNPAVSMAFDRGNNNSYCYGSSSNLSNSSVSLHRSPMLAPQHWACNPINLPANYWNNSLLATAEGLVTTSEGSQRNVRSRQGNAFHLEQSPSVIHPSNNLPHHFHPTANISGLTASGQWNHTSVSSENYRRIVSSESGCFSHEMNQSLIGNNSTNSITEMDRGYTHSVVHNRSLTSHLPMPHVPSQAGSVSHDSYSHRRSPYRAVPSYHSIGFVVDDGRRLESDFISSSRHARPLSIIGRSGERSSRSLIDRIQPFSHENNISGGWAFEDRSNFYDLRNLHDQHRDMRLDIDNMSYEELLALEERMGNVSTGLSEDHISRCMEIIYWYSNQTQDTKDCNCVICLDEYEDRESLGRLTCGHDFHASCIRTWLSIKNACPICKNSALPDSEKEK